MHIMAKANDQLFFLIQKINAHFFFEQQLTKDKKLKNDKSSKIKNILYNSAINENSSDNKANQLEKLG